MKSKKPKKDNLKEHGEFTQSFTACDESDEIELNNQFEQEKVGHKSYRRTHHLGWSNVSRYWGFNINC